MAQGSMRGCPSDSCQGHFDLTAPVESARQTRPDSTDSPGSSVARQNKGPVPFGSRAFTSYRGGCHTVTLSEVSSLYYAPGTSAYEYKP